MRMIGEKRVVARYIGESPVAARYVGEDLIFKNDDGWYIIDELLHHFDYINNTGSGHDPLATMWADLAGEANASLVGVSFGPRSIVFAGNNNAKVQYSGQNVGIYTIFNTHLVTARQGQHPRIFGENPYPTLYLQSNHNYSYGLYAQSIDTFFLPQFIPPMNTVIATAMRWAGPGSPIELFVNGEKVAQLGPTNVYPGNTTVKYLGANSGTARTLTGEFFEHLVYSRALTDAEIQHNFQVSKARYSAGDAI